MKKVTIKFISIYVDIFGKEIALELDDNARVKDLIDYIERELSERNISIKPIVFVNYRFSSEDQLLRDGDEVLVMPPFAGG
ncbi:MAG: MoaD/ThiS family protein [Desulfurococcaceae archaeon]